MQACETKASDGEASDQQDASVPEIILLVENTRKGINLGPFLRCASAFGIQTIVVVGYDKCSVQGSHGASKHVQLVAFPTVNSAVEYIQRDFQCRNIIGHLGSCPDAFSEVGYPVIIDADRHLLRLGDPDNMQQQEPLHARRSFPVSSYPFPSGNICIAFGRSDRGLTSTFADCCMGFIHVPYQRTASIDDSLPCLLDAQSSLSIVLHHYTNWAGYDEHTFTGHKYQVKRRSTQSNSDDAPGHAEQQAHRQERKRHNEVDAEATMEDALGTLFHDE